jgi:hypothetical protein
VSPATCDADNEADRQLRVPQCHAWFDPAPLQRGSHFHDVNGCYHAPEDPGNGVVVNRGLTTTDAGLIDDTVEKACTARPGWG